MSTIYQPTIFGTEDVLDIGAPRPAASGRIRVSIRPAPLFEDAEQSVSQRPVGVPRETWKRFLADAKNHAIAHPKAAPLRFASWIRNPTPARRGRPSTRPDGYPDDICEGYRRMRARRLSRDPNSEIPSIDDWIRDSERWREVGRAGGIAARSAMRQVVEWVVVVPRRELNKHPDLELAWAKRINNEPDIGRRYRIHLRGVQRRST